MKLNNKGFAITSIIYSMLVLFLTLVVLIIGNLANRKAVFDKQKEELLNKVNPEDGEIASIHKECNFISGDINTIGSEIACGTEIFNLISVDGGTVKMLAANNINLDLDNPIQSTTAGKIKFSDNLYWTNQDSTDFLDKYSSSIYKDASGNYGNNLLYPYVNAYQDYLVNTLKIEGATASMLSITDVTGLGCSVGSECSNYPWLHNTTYWLDGANTTYKGDIYYILPNQLPDGVDPEMCTGDSSCLEYEVPSFHEYYYHDVYVIGSKLNSATVFTYRRDEVNNPSGTISAGDFKCGIRPIVTISKNNIGNSRLPVEYKELEYIESTGTQYIDTEVIPNQNTGFDIEFLTKNAIVGNPAGGTSGYGTILGARQKSSNNELQLTTYGSSSFAGTLRFGTSGSYNAGLVPGTKMRVVLKNGIYTNNNGVEHTLSQTFQSPVSLTVFALNQNGSIIQYGLVQLYSLKLYDGDNLIRYYIPCYRKSDDVRGLYDLVEDKFYSDSGTGTKDFYIEEVL